MYKEISGPDLVPDLVPDPVLDLVRFMVPYMVGYMVPYVTPSTTMESTMVGGRRIWYQIRTGYLFVHQTSVQVYRPPIVPSRAFPLGRQSEPIAH